MTVLTFTWTTILSSYGINTPVVVSNDSVHIRWLSWAHIYGTNMSMVVSKSSMTSVKWRAWMYTMLFTQNKAPFSIHNMLKAALNTFTITDFLNWHRLQIILALVIPNHNTPAFCNKGAVVLINNAMATSEVTRVRISCESYQPNSWPKILVCGTHTPQVLCNIYNSPYG